MRSFIAALRSLTLPFGRTTGARIVLDGTTGLIQVYDSANDLVAQIGPEFPNEGFQTFNSANGNVEMAAGRIVLTNPDDYLMEIGASFIAFGAPNDQSVLNIDDDAHLFFTPMLSAEDPSNSFDVETWHAFAFQNGWAADAGNVTPRYRMRPDGWVQFRGTLQGGTTVPGTVIANLPAAWRPNAGADHYFTVAMPNNNTVNGTIDVLANGNVRCIYSPGVASLSLDQISFPSTLIP